MVSEQVWGKAKRVAELQAQAERAKDELAAAWERVNQTEDGRLITALSADIARISQEAHEEGVLVKAVVVSAFKADPAKDKHPVPWANIVEKTVIDIDPVALLEWAKENSPWFLMLNIPLVQEVAPSAQKRGQEFPGVRIYTEPSAQWNNKGLAQLLEAKKEFRGER